MQDTKIDLKEEGLPKSHMDERTKRLTKENGELQENLVFSKHAHIYNHTPEGYICNAYIDF